MSFLIAKCGTFIRSRTDSLNAWTSRKAKRARTRLHLQHSPGTSMCQDPGPLPGGNTMPTGVPNFPGRCGRTSVTGMSTSIYRLTLVQVDVSTGFSESGAPKADGFWAPGVG